MSSIDTVFFDWGGVIADDPGDDFLLNLLRKIGASETQAQEIYGSTMRQFIRGEITEADYWQRLREEYGFTVHDTISEEFKDWNGLKVNPAILTLVQQAKDAGLKVALLTNVIEPTHTVLDRAGYYDCFDIVIASCKVGLAKPQSEIYQLALDRLETTAEHSLFIDDKQRNIEPAKQLGFHTILAQSPEQIITDTNRYIAGD